MPILLSSSLTLGPTPFISDDVFLKRFAFHSLKAMVSISTELPFGNFDTSYAALAG